ncbi:serine/threonine-protein kinase PknH/PknJ [Mycolicibacillus trivialis]
MIPIGAVVAGYRVRRVIGSGGMGTIYAVDDPQLPRLDALKVLSAELCADPKFRARFVREADVAAGLDHPNIVSIYDRGETRDGQLWIAMQLVDGTDADAAIRTGTMNPRRAVHIINEVAEALDYAHAHQVLHRDVKPANFLLTGPVGPDERVLLGDFGIARAVDDAGLTGTNMVMATMAYAAPEVLEGRPIDFRSDLYSLGCALFHLLTNQVPYADTTGASAQAMAHLRRPPPQPSAVAPGLGPMFDHVIATAMAKDPAQRYPSGRALAEAAKAALAQRDHTTDPQRPDSGPHSSPTLLPPTVAPPRSSRGKLIGIVAGVAVVAVAAGAVALFAGGKSDDQASPPTAPPSHPPTSAAPTVASSDLASLMLPDNRLTEAVGAATKAGPEPWREFARDTYADCGGIVYPMQSNSYSGSGSVDKYVQVGVDVRDQTRSNVVQGVVAFPSADLAARFVDRQRALWPPCAYQTVRVSASNDQPEFFWRITDVNATGDIITAKALREDNGRTCQHALTSMNNIVVDVLACSADKSNPGLDIARGIADGIPHA